MHLNDIFLKPKFQMVRGRYRCYVPDYLGPDECWEWLGARKKGYGTFATGEKHQRIRAHRIAYILANGPIPDRLNGSIACVLHKCDNPACCNPKHLFLGTNRMNIDDMMAKGRSLKGDRHPRATMTEEQAVALINSNDTAAKAAKRLGLKTSTVQAVRSGASFQHLAHLPRAKIDPVRHSRARLTPEQVEAIRKDTRPRKPIAEQYGIGVRQVGKIRLGYQWKN